MTRGVALLLTVATGFSGLVYEVAWQKYLATLLGSHSEATAAVLGLFLGGLALGYAAFGALSHRLVARARARGRAAPLLPVYGSVEAGIGLYALLFPALFRGAQALSFALPALPEGAGFAVDLVLAALLIGPPAVLMGGTIPLLTQALARSLADATRFHAFVYAFNTAGAFAGALAAGFWLVPALGLVGVLQAMAGLNLTAGAVFVLLGLRTAPPTSAPAALGPQASAASAQRAAGERSPESLSAQRGEAERSSPARIEGLVPYATVALLVGFAMMSVQTVLIRLGGLAFGSSQFTFSMVVAVFVLCIALGSFAVSALPRIPSGVLGATLWALVALLAFLHLRLDEAPYWAHVLRSWFQDHEAAFYPYYLSAFLGVLAVIGPPVVLSGATLPLIFDRLRREVADLGEVAGIVYSWNTVGSLLGAVLGGYALLFWWDLDDVFRLALAAVAVAAALATARVLPARRRWAAGALLATGLAALAALPGWDPDRLASGLFRHRRPQPGSYDGPAAFFGRDSGSIAFYTDDPTASVAVHESRDATGTLHRAILNNGKSDGDVPGDYVTMGLAALVPALFAERAERAFVIGYGTGVTAGEFASLETAREVVVAEISRGVIEAAPLFDFGNVQASQNPKLRVIRGDAYRTLRRSRASFDVIASEPSNPWVTGVEMLFSREFLESARDHLTPGGVYAQWFHVYETDDETVAMVMRTYASVFDHIAVWYAIGPDLLLLGFRDPSTALDLPRLARRAGRPDFAAGLRRCGIGSMPELLAHELLPLGVINALSLPGEVHTLLHPQLSYLAARGFFTGGTGALPSTVTPEPARLGAEHSLLGRLAARRGGRLSDRDWRLAVSETCEYRGPECLTRLAKWTYDVPQSRARERVLARIREDPTLAERTHPGLIEPLSRLYGGDAAETPDGILATANRASQLFAEHYHHAAPFDRRHLAELWDRCAADSGQARRCRRGRRRAERTLGPL
jgi:spermidine synthase